MMCAHRVERVHVQPCLYGSVSMISLFRLLLEEVLYVVIWYHLLLEGISTSLRRLDHLDNLRV